jgi:hypothetical protein
LPREHEAADGPIAQRCTGDELAARGQHRSERDSSGNPSAAYPLPHEMKKPQVLAAKELGEWRRRGSNPNTTFRNSVAGQQLTNFENPLSGNCQEIDGTTWLDLASVDTELRYVIERWNRLSDKGRHQIVDICQNAKED